MSATFMQRVAATIAAGNLACGPQWRTLEEDVVSTVGDLPVGQGLVLVESCSTEYLQMLAA